MNEEELKKKIGKSLTDYLETTQEYSEEELEEIVLKREEILEKLMSAKFRDIGGLVAMRGFIYQYYVAIYYILLMITSEKNSWWHSVVLEYFDDVTLIGDDKIRFIQVKTIKENGKKVHQFNNFTSRTKMKTDSNSSEIKHFNSWIEKNFSNYDYFLNENNFLDLDKQQFRPQFEIVTNNYYIIEKLGTYERNTDFDLKEVNLDKDPLKMELSKSANDKNFEEVFKKELEFYLNRFKLTTLRSTIELSVTILNIIEEYIEREEIIIKGDNRAKSISVYVFQNLLTYVIKNSHDDNEEKLDKKDLVITKSIAANLIQEWSREIKELISIDDLNDSAHQLFKRSFITLNREIETNRINPKMKTEMLNTLNSVNKIISENLEKDKTYCLKVVNKIFKGDNAVLFWDLEDSNIQTELTEAIRFIVYFLVFCQEHYEKHESAKFLFHEGKFEEYEEYIENIMFTIFHAQKKSSKEDSIEKIIFLFEECEESRSITFELYCLLIGTKNMENTSNDKFAGLKKLVGNVGSRKITNVPRNLKFIDSSSIEVFIEHLIKAEEKIDSFRQNEVVNTWIDFLESESKEIKEKHVEN